MNKFTLFILFSFSQTLLIAQTMVLDSIINLSTYAQECSGMIFCNQKLIACNDSGGENCLFEIDTATGQVTKKIYIENASNADWEALAQDSLHIYIGDIGNNLGNRTNLCIYKINKNAYFNTTNDTISAEKIFYSYADQNAFIASNQNTPYDAEALVCINDSLYIFTKDWVNQHTSIYAMPTLAGTYSLEKRTQYDVQALVTDAAYDAELNHIYLTAYTKLAVPYILYLKPDMPNLFFEGIYWRKQALVKGSFQIESICKANQNRYYVGAEKFFTAASLLSSFYDSTLLINSIAYSFHNENETVFFPNPVNAYIELEKDVKWIVIFTQNGQLLKETHQNKIDVQDLAEGVYFIRIIKENNQIEMYKFYKE